MELDYDQRPTGQSLYPVWAVLAACLLAMVVLQRLLVWGFGAYADPKPFLEADKWKALCLIDRVELNHNTRRFRSSRACQLAMLL